MNMRLGPVSYTASSSYETFSGKVLSGEATAVNPQPQQESKGAAPPSVKNEGYLGHVSGLLGALDQQPREIAKGVSAASGMTPGDMILMTMRCTEFSFNCQILSTVTGKLSDGAQQLFRQGS